MTATDLKLGSELFWQGALLAMLIDLVLVSLLLWRIKPTGFRQLKWVLVGASAIYWGIFGYALLWGFWDSYYCHFYPDTMRWLGAVGAVPYGAIGFALWWFTSRVSGNPIAIFLLLGGLEGLLEHLWAVYGWGILEKAPILQNASALSVLVFSFLEYVLYWGIILGLAARFQGTSRVCTKLQKRRANAA
jgi:hypothetical protein